MLFSNKFGFILETVFSDIEFHYAECGDLHIVMPNVAMMSVVVLNVIMLSVVMLNVVMLSVVMLSVVMLNVVGPG